MKQWDTERTLVRLRAPRGSTNGAPAVFPDLRARPSRWRPWLLALLYPACFALGALAVALGVRP